MRASSSTSTFVNRFLSLPPDAVSASSRWRRPGLTRDFARDELEDVTTLLVDSKETRRFSKANTLKMQEIRGDRIGPWAARPSDGVADAHDIVSDVAAQERRLRAIRWSR